MKVEDKFVVIAADVDRDLVVLTIGDADPVGMIGAEAVMVAEHIITAAKHLAHAAALRARTAKAAAAAPADVPSAAAMRMN